MRERSADPGKHSVQAVVGGGSIKDNDPRSCRGRLRGNRNHRHRHERGRAFVALTNHGDVGTTAADQCRVRWILDADRIAKPHFGSK